MRCNDFLHHYSTFRDGAAPPQLRHSMELHLAWCATCARYHEAVRRGVDALKNAGGIEPSADFRRRLHGRLAVDGVASIDPAPAGVAAALMFAAALTLGVYEGVIRERHTPPPVTVAIRASRPPSVMPYAAHRAPPASDFTLSAFRQRGGHAPVVVVDASPVPLGMWASLPR